jgi:hypothetical protein
MGTSRFKSRAGHEKSWLKVSANHPLYLLYLTNFIPLRFTNWNNCGVIADVMALIWVNWKTLQDLRLSGRWQGRILPSGPLRTRHRTLWYKLPHISKYDLHLKEPGWLSRYSDWLRAGRLRVRSSSPGRVKNFLFSTSSRPALGSTQPPIQRIPGDLSPRVKRLGRETDHSPPTSAKVKKKWIYTSTPP